MTKVNKMMCFDQDVFDHLSTVQPNASSYVQDLIYADIRRIDKLKKKEVIDINEIHKSAVQDAEALLKKEAEKNAHNTAWGLLDLEVREEIKDLPNWGEKWHTIFYPMYASKGGLTLKDVRDWYFANKEGFKL
jgi:hypothetical protein